MDYEYYMKLALVEAKAAFYADETPVGCIIVDSNGTIIGQGRNMRAQQKNVLYHAELIAINQACGALNDWRLSETTLFVTIEPCPMCAGTIVMSRVGTVVFGARNPKAGCAGSILNLLDEPRLNHRVNIVEGVLGDECGSLMTEFFRDRLNKIIQAKQNR